MKPYTFFDRWQKGNGKDALKLFPANVRLTAGQEQETSDVREFFKPTCRMVTLSIYAIRAADAFVYFLIIDRTTLDASKKGDVDTESVQTSIVYTFLITFPFCLMSHLN
jgi:hypothetical protein